MRHNEKAVSTRFFISLVFMDNILISLNREQAENLEMLLEQGIRELPDDAEELAAADPFSYAGTLRDLLQRCQEATIVVINDSKRSTDV